MGTRQKVESLKLKPERDRLKEFMEYGGEIFRETGIYLKEEPDESQLLIYGSPPGRWISADE